MVEPAGLVTVSVVGSTAAVAAEALPEASGAEASSEEQAVRTMPEAATSAAMARGWVRMANLHCRGQGELRKASVA
ncbi:hypothetical protein GCM10025876_22080 [Demequina litorisediminis]|uniref:Uncharacterized protein n=1 Tax=Demequina litorisediminis TaxID=1849022 RepID=A0ABQ6IE68_9MICO|nr:hypothetical protein GCM10025876_22080 [Demequina litorisediminis]